MKTIEQQTGWKRPYPKMVCKDQDVLSKVNHFDFDLLDDEFRNYFIRRTGININQTFGGIKKREKNIDLKFKTRNAQLQDCWELYLNEIDDISNIILKTIIENR